MERESVYVGIDIDEEASMISFYHADMTEPETISTIAGSEMYQIPTYLSKKKGMGQWFFGREARVRNKPLCIMISQNSSFLQHLKTLLGCHRYSIYRKPQYLFHLPKSSLVPQLYVLLRHHFNGALLQTFL